MKNGNILKFVFCLLSFCFLSQSQSEETYVVHKFYPKYFSLNGYDFPYSEKELLFPVDLGTKLIIEERELIPLAGDSYQIALTLQSPQNGITQKFTSTIMNDSDVESLFFIENAIETQRKLVVVKQLDQKPGSALYFNRYVAEIRYDLILSDGTTHKAFYRTPFYDTETECLNHINDFQVVAGDFVSMGAIESRCENCLKYRSYPAIYHQSEVYHHKNGSSSNLSFAPKLTLGGKLRLPSKDHPQNGFLVNKVMHKEVKDALNVSHLVPFAFKLININHNVYFETNPEYIPNVGEKLKIKSFNKMNKIYIFEHSKGKDIFATLRIENIEPCQHPLWKDFSIDD